MRITKRACNFIQHRCVCEFRDLVLQSWHNIINTRTKHNQLWKKIYKNEKKFHEAVCILKRECHLWTPIRSEHGRLAPHISLYLAGLASPSCFIPHEKWQYRCRSAGRGSCQAAMFAHFLRGLMAWSDVGAVAKNSAKPGRSPLARHSHGIQHIKYVSSVHGWNC